MAANMEASLKQLVEILSYHKSVRAVGLSGGERPLPQPGEGDIDIFVYCAEIPTHDQRQKPLASFSKEIEQVQVGKLTNGHWGQGDSFLMAGIETWLLYFTVAEAQAELEAILNRQYLGRLDSYYYPMGRCAMWKSMRALYDPDGLLHSFKQRLNEYPAELAQAIINHHLEALEDVEDLERAVSRADVFFYHFALDLALDHFLQALFAMNQEYFPSRKRSERYMRGFQAKPSACEQRLRQVLELGGKPETLGQSYGIWSDLVRELKVLPEKR